MDLLHHINDYIKSFSNLELKRNYIGMSSLGDCAKETYNKFLHGITPDEVQYRNSFRGYQQERLIKEMLCDIGFMRPNSERELKYGVDDIVKGHTDGESQGGDLIEIKSMNLEKFNRVRENRKVARRLYFQIQTYMHFGNYQKCTAVISCPETTEFQILPIRQNRVEQCAIISLADTLIKAVQTGIEPVCFCHKCKESNQKVA